ncbi:MAG: ThiF family adenylyltransferase [Sulfurimicrobium sp.]|nr:ThiF family adenylyltransferase [Sulfurimicrobium sp.]MDP2200138.1 ThiF family adenylyltransferase [Sulfurimicrobium sp.]MDP3689128.1 ThiF family adenylyltransferase [Sulfurimicrobium sp.]
MTEFDYENAFSRNLGIVDSVEHARLRQSTVAIAGMGGVGGDYLISLVRAGVGGFHIAEFDEFELANFNRQYGANTRTLGRRKIEVMLEYALEINPELRVKIFDKGINTGNIDEFLSNVDLIVDGVDVFAVDIHPLLINSASARGLVTIAAVPLGLGAGILAFGPGGMSYDNYFAISPDMSEEEKIIQFALGFSPEMHHLKYLDPKSINLKARKGPSSIAGCKLCAGFITTQALLALLHPSEIKLVPWYTYLDARLSRFHHRRLWMGNRNPLQRLKGYVAKKRLENANG